MSKLIEQVSIGCAVNCAIVNDAMSRKDGTFIDSCINVPVKYNIIPPQPDLPWPFQNSSWEAYKLYCMIVVPKELYKLGNNDPFYTNLTKNNAMRNFNIIKEKESFLESPIYHFKSLRNSISHVNYSIKDNGTFIMWDHKPNLQSEKHWHIEITRKDMNIFLGEINEELFRLYNEINQGIRDRDNYNLIDK